MLGDSSVQRVPSSPSLLPISFGISSAAPGLSFQQATHSGKSADEHQRAAHLVTQVTLEGKFSQRMDQAPTIPRFDIPECSWWFEASYGVARLGYATAFPQALGMPV